MIIICITIAIAFFQDESRSLAITSNKTLYFRTESMEGNAHEL